MLLAAYTLWRRDIVRFFRQRSRLVGALLTPVVFWLLLGSGLGRSFHAASSNLDGGYLEYFFPGTLALIVLFTAIFSTISLIEDRQAGFMQGVLVAPVPRTVIVVGKLLGGTTLAVAQATLFLVAAPAAGLVLTPGELPALVLTIALLAFALTGLGFVIAWSLNSTQGFHAIMNLLLVPMWLLSGAAFPASGAAAWLRVLMAINPMTYGVSALQHLTLDHAAGPGFGVSMAVTAIFGVVMLAGAAALVRTTRQA
jgi:ABC-2 type transport system permease protein